MDLPTWEREVVKFLVNVNVKMYLSKINSNAIQPPKPPHTTFFFKF